MLSSLLKKLTGVLDNIMNIREKKAQKLLIAVAVTFVLVFLSYPYQKALLDKVHTYYQSTHYGKEVIYSYIEEGDIRVANQILEDKYEISRFSPVEIKDITWKEDPYSDIYWRFNYYNLQPVRDLLFAWRTTKEEKYQQKMVAIVESFIDSGMAGPYSWDYHGTAFRAMTLIDVREKLLRENKLPRELNEKIIRALKVHGDFLADPSHFEKDFNHGLDQSAALFLLSVNLSSIDDAQGWLHISSERIKDTINRIVDEDGVLVENSPYYHLYVLEKIFEIDSFLRENGLSIDGFPDQKIDKMISYAVYMLQPDLTVPLIGASISRQMGLAGMYKEMASRRSDLLYVLTRGRYGTRPEKLNVQFPSSGEAIMRSDWGRGSNYSNQTQLIFDVGDYRTNHSDLDALSFNLFGRGTTLMPDAGLYSYDAEPYRTYFHGTRAHNTIVVDGKDQEVGNIYEGKKVEMGSFQEGDGFVYQSGRHNLYSGVSHQRSMILIEDSTVLIFDSLKSSTDHRYEQMFHLFPGAQVDTDGHTLTAKGNNPEQQVTIKQYLLDGVDASVKMGETTPFDGWCSPTYNEAVPCASVSYAKSGKNISYVTSISIGKVGASISYDADSNTIFVRSITSGNQYRVKVDEMGGSQRFIEVDKGDISELSNSYDHANGLSDLISNNWIASTPDSQDAFLGSVSVSEDGQSLKLKTSDDGSYFSASKTVKWDLSQKNLYFKIKVDKMDNLQGIDVSLSNDKWKTDAKFNVEKIINYNNYQGIYREGEWIQFGASKGELRRSTQGSWLIASWKKSGVDFDWSKVDGIKFIVKSKLGTQAEVSLKDFVLVPDQKETRILINFDDGWSSVMDAANLMRKFGMKGSTGIITNAVGKKSYLTLEEVKRLQNEYGWDIVSHSNLHKNSITEYAQVNDLEGFDNDTQDALQYLIRNGINSAPNWYVYPDGSTNDAVKSIIGKYYKFARATTIVPQPFPFPDPLEVGVFQVYSDRASVLDVYNAIDDAKKYHQTLFLMFHKLSNGPPLVFTEYSKDDFNSILEKIQKEGIKVVTFSEFDQENNIPETKFTLHEQVPGQVKIDVSLQRSWRNTIKKNFSNIWESIIGFRKHIGLS